MYYNRQQEKLLLLCTVKKSIANSFKTAFELDTSYMLNRFTNNLTCKFSLQLHTCILNNVKPVIPT